MDIEQEKMNLHFGAVDRSDRLTLAATFDFFQEAAINHAEALGVGRDAMIKTGQIWVLSRLSVVWDRRPKWREALTVRSWPRGWEKLFALRDYDIRDAGDVPVVRGRGCWIILDLEKRRPLRPQAIMETLPLNDGLDALTGVPGAIAPCPESGEQLKKAGERRAVYSDVDYNGHVNNTRYIQWIQDIMDPAILEQCERARLDINYLGEVKLGETVELWMLPAGNSGAGLPVGDGNSNDANQDDWDWAAFFEGRRRAGDPGENTQPAFRAELRVIKDR
jgi:acyl-ACP thioesterase